MATTTRPVTSERHIYTGEATRAVAMPLGGIGTGTIALAGDGSLRQWQIHNQVNHMACLPHSFFAVWTRSVHPSNDEVARVLQSGALYDTTGAPAPPTSSDHIVPIPHRRLLSKLPGVEATTFTGRYPIAEVAYHDPALPLDITMEAFNPFIPLNAPDSAIPAVFLNVTVTNTSSHRRHVAIAASLQNAVGWDGVAPIFDTRCQLYGGNVNTLTRTTGSTTIGMGTSRLPDDAPGYGTMALTAVGTAGSADATYLTQWDDLTALWDDFRTDGRFADIADATPSASGRTWNGALAIRAKMAPGETRTFPFLIAWHFPNRYVNHNQSTFFDFDDDKSKFWLGNEYATRFGSALDVVTHVERDRERLTRETRLARETLYDTTLPFSVIESVVSQASIIRSPTCFRDEKGHFYGFEGCNGASTSHHTEPYGGCCPLNCTHVWNYEMALARLYPELERDMRDTEWHIQQHPGGALPHRVLVPTYLPRPWDRPIGGPEHPALDGLLGAILKTYREHRASGDDAWLDRAWPAVRLALDHLWRDHDPERTGVILGEQPNTYDISIYGANTFTGTLYLAALRSVEEMATRRGENDLAATCREVFERGRATLEERLWNGEYYIQEVDLEAYPEQNWGLGCHADHLMGQWWAHTLGLGHLLDPDRVRSAVGAIVRHNFSDTIGAMSGVERQFATDEDEGLLICTWPNGGRPDVPTRYSDEVWTGLEYEVAALLLHEGLPDEAVTILDATRARYDGRKQNPWNDIECGDHYVRAMASWTLLEAASGFRYDAASGSLAFAPVMLSGSDADAYRAPFVTRDGWGTYMQRADGATIEVTWGTLDLEELALRLGSGEGPVEVTVDGEEVRATVTSDDGETRIAFAPPVTIPTGGVLTVTTG